MCEDCGTEDTDAYTNWLKHHRPHDLEENRDHVSVMDQSIDILLTLRFDTLTVEEITSNFKVTEEKAREISRTCNTILASMEDFLIGMLNH